MPEKQAPGQPEVLNQNQPVWEIYPSCDIRLGEYFSADPELFKGFVLDIDTDSIQNVLATLDTEPNPCIKQPTQLRFEISPLESLLPNIGTYQDSSKPLKQRFVFGRYRSKSKNHTPEHSAKCTVGINMGRVVQSIAASGLKKIHTFPITQGTAVHELQHAIDYKNKYSQLPKSFRNIWKNRFNEIVATYAEKTGGSDVSTTLRYAHYRNQPIEIRAREAEKQAGTFAPIVSLRPYEGYDEYKQKANKGTAAEAD